MITTGILSLNIHDSLAFDGIELCLNPDIFTRSEYGGAAGIGASSICSGNSASNDTLTEMSAGDIIEVRVWDPLPKEADRINSPASSTGMLKHLQHSSIPLTHVQMNNILGSASFGRDHKSTIFGEGRIVEPGGAIPNLRHRHKNLFEQNVLHDKAVIGGQNVIVSSPKSDSGNDRKSLSDLYDGRMKDKAVPIKTALATTFNHNIFNSCSVIPITTNNAINMTELYTQQQLPPIFPRNRSGTVEASNLHVFSTSKSRKPQTITYRRATSSSVAMPFPKRSPKQQRRQLNKPTILSTGHSRTISDMTADTTCQLDNIINDGTAIYRLEFPDVTIDKGVPTDNSYNTEVLNITTTHRLRLSFVLKVTEKTLTSFKGNSRTQISILRKVANLYNLSNYDFVTVHKIEPQDEEEVMKAVSADFVVVTIKDQYISRGDMLSFQTKLIGSWIYEGQRLTESTQKIKAHAREIRHGNFSAKSGIVTDRTNITFRSRSARIVWLVQLSLEMWEYSLPYERQYEPESVCEIYFDQWIRFLYKLFKKWKELEGVKSSLFCQDVYGRMFEDHYKPVIENETCVDWDSLIVRIKEEFTKFPLEVGWNLSDRKPCCASQGNILEAINVVLNLMQYHYLDRDLHRTGQSIVIISPGCGVFEVDKGLAGITYQRMMDNGIGSDMLSLGLPPLHIAPFFLYNNEFHSVETQGIDESDVYYEVPHWMHLSFVIYDRPEEKRVYLRGLENKTTPVHIGHWFYTYDRVANGFLRPYKFHESTLDSQHISSKNSSFSAAGNMAATPGKAKLVQEQGQARQLISGRKFTDILEACRPRIPGATLPHPLKSLLSLRIFEIGDQAVNENRTKESSIEKKDCRLREWGTIDLNEYSLHSRFKIHKGSGFGLKKVVRNQSIINSDRSFSFSGSDDGSDSSSLGSRSLVSTHGNSFDRVFWDYYEIPNTRARAFHMQRSPSIKYDELGKNVIVDGSFEAIDDSSTMSGNISNVCLSFGGDSKNNLSISTKTDRHKEYLYKFMDSYNTVVCQPPHEGNDDMIESNHRHDSMLLGEPDNVRMQKNGALGHYIRQKGKDGELTGGGLEAALSRYSVNEEGPSIQEHTSTFLQRRGSGGPFFSNGNNTTSFNSERRRAASPILILRAQQEKIGNSKFLSSFIPSTIDPQGTCHPGQLRTSNIQRPFSNQGIINRERSNSIGGASTNISQVGISSMNRLVCDSNRQTIPPPSQSPPSSAVFFNSTSLTTPKFYPYSPNLTAAHERFAPNTTLAQSPPLLESSYDKLLSHTPPNTSYRPRDRTALPSVTGERERSGSSKLGGRDSPLGSIKTPIISRRKKAFNPFRQRDEDEVLAKRSHNRRRWSHVYPEGEVEFKRHAGPIWNSLTSPAILPLAVDHFPTPQELRDENTFQFSFYQVTLGGNENNHYEKHADLLKEMVRQRVTQDFQIVTDDAIIESKKRAAEPQIEGRNGQVKLKSSRRVETFTRPLPSTEQEMMRGIKHHYLSMGHKIQVMNYDPSSDTIEIVLYNRKSAQNDRENIHVYNFFLFSKVTGQYTVSIQTFKKYNEPYKWNRVDNLICGEADRTMDVGMRFRRVMFGLIPGSFKKSEDEEEYVSKFRKLLLYLEKLRGDCNSNLDVEIVTTNTRRNKIKEEFVKARHDMNDTMIRFPVQLLRGKKDPFEWIEVAISATFDTSMSFRIIFNWLVASSAKVEAQVQLLQRRFRNFGLRFISFPQTTVSWDLFIHALNLPFHDTCNEYHVLKLAAPTFISLRDPKNADAAETILSGLDFVNDGVTITSPQFLECIDSGDFRFPHYRSGRVKAIPSKQFVHRSGAIFIRKIADREGKVILVGIENYRHASNENRFRQIAKSVVKKVIDLIESLPASRK